MSDSISDFLTIIRNAYLAGKETCHAKYSKVHMGIARILKEEGYLRDVREGQNDKGHKNIELILKYVGDTPAVTGIKRASKPGRRLYCGHDEIPKVLNGLGISILTTNKGILRDREARRQKIGGELICTVW